MSFERGTRDRRSIPVEGGASGAADTFDGNQTNDIVSWLFANSQWTEESVAQALAQLMEHTAMGHLAWVVFPREGFRL